VLIQIFVTPFFVVIGCQHFEYLSIERLTPS
jgi:hypothetical protein